MQGWVLGIDIGGTGSRVALRHVGDATRREVHGDTVAIAASGSSAPDVAASLVRQAAAEWPDEFRSIRSIALGASGIASLVASPEAVPYILRRVAIECGAPEDLTVATAIDAFTAHLGALEGEPGAVVALGTGAIALGTDGADIWRRVDGWGHLLGDRGGGAWIGRRALEYAMQAFDGVNLAGVGLLEHAVMHFGDPAGWPKRLYTTDDRASVLAGFVPWVVRADECGDQLADSILREAGEAAARSVIAALGPDLPPRVALIGGLAKAVPKIHESFTETATFLRKDVLITVTGHDPLDGALLLAERAANGVLESRAPFLWVGDCD